MVQPFSFPIPFLFSLKFFFPSLHYFFKALNQNQLILTQVIVSHVESVEDVMVQMVSNQGGLDELMDSLDALDAAGNPKPAQRPQLNALYIARYYIMGVQCCLYIFLIFCKLHILYNLFVLITTQRLISLTNLCCSAITYSYTHIFIKRKKAFGKR